MATKQTAVLLCRLLLAGVYCSALARASTPPEANRVVALEAAGPTRALALRSDASLWLVQSTGKCQRLLTGVQHFTLGPSNTRVAALVSRPGDDGSLRLVVADLRGNEKGAFALPPGRWDRPFWFRAGRVGIWGHTSAGGADVRVFALGRKASKQDRLKDVRDALGRYEVLWDGPVFWRRGHCGLVYGSVVGQRDKEELAYLTDGEISQRWACKTRLFDVRIRAIRHPQYAAAVLWPSGPADTLARRDTAGNVLVLFPWADGRHTVLDLPEPLRAGEAKLIDLAFHSKRGWTFLATSSVGHQLLLIDHTGTTRVLERNYRETLLVEGRAHLCDNAVVWTDGKVIKFMRLSDGATTVVNPDDCWGIRKESAP